MGKSFRRRIRNINPQLACFIKEGEKFHVGLLFENYLECPNLDKYNLPKSFGETKLLPSAKGTVTKANTKGKFVRKQPEEKHTVIKHISYYRKNDRVHVSYNREFNIYKKIKLHQFEMNLIFAVNQHGQEVVVSEPLTYQNTDTDVLKNTHAANLFNEIFGDFEIFDDKLNPAIHFNTKFDQVILPKGTLSNPLTLNEILDIGARFSNNDSANKAFQSRIKTLTRYKPDIRGKGPEGFYGYLVFGFADLGIVILETMYAGNATYVFAMDTFENNIIKDKQTVLGQKLHLKRFVHHDEWTNKIQAYLDELKIKN